MSGKIEPRTLKGFRDTMPVEASARNRMFRTIEGLEPRTASEQSAFDQWLGQVAQIERFR